MTVAFGQRAAAALERVHEVLSVGLEIAHPVGPCDLVGGEQSVGAVRFDGVSFRMATATTCSVGLT